MDRLPVQIFGALALLALAWSAFVVVADRTSIGEPVASRPVAPAQARAPFGDPQEAREIPRSRIHALQAELLEISNAGQDGERWSADVKITNTTGQDLPRYASVMCDLFTPGGHYITSSNAVHNPDPLKPGASIEGETSAALPRGAVVSRFECELN